MFKLSIFLIVFALFSTLLWLFVGPIGILYGAGIVLFFWLADGIAALLDPKTFAQDKPPSDPN